MDRACEWVSCAQRRIKWCHTDVRALPPQCIHWVQTLSCHCHTIAFQLAGVHMCISYKYISVLGFRFWRAFFLFVALVSGLNDVSSPISPWCQSGSAENGSRNHMFWVGTCFGFVLSLSTVSLWTDWNMQSWQCRQKLPRHWMCNQTKNYFESQKRGIPLPGSPTVQYSRCYFLCNSKNETNQNNMQHADGFVSLLAKNALIAGNVVESCSRMEDVGWGPISQHGI